MAFVPRDGRSLIGRATATGGQKDSAEAMTAQAIRLSVGGRRPAPLRLIVQLPRYMVEEFWRYTN
jgi:hypothetical protein